MTSLDSNYEYRGMMAQFWDLLRGDTSQWEDRFFYLDVIQESGQPVLDVGCGTGRLLIDYLSQGIDIDGVDNSPEMLALCAQKAAAINRQASLYQQSMQALSLPRRYQTILVPSSSFQLLITPEQAQTAMQRFYAHLLPGGVLVMPFMLIWSGESDQPVITEEFSREVTRPQDGAIIRRRSISHYEQATQLESTEDIYEVILDGVIIASEKHSRSPATRGYRQEQALSLYREAGFSDIRLLSGFTFEPAKADDFVFTLIGKRPF